MVPGDLVQDVELKKQVDQWMKETDEKTGLQVSKGDSGVINVVVTTVANTKTIEKYLKALKDSGELSVDFVAKEGEFLEDLLELAVKYKDTVKTINLNALGDQVKREHVEKIHHQLPNARVLPESPPD